MKFNTDGFSASDWLRAEIVRRFAISRPCQTSKHWKRKTFDSNDLTNLFDGKKPDEFQEYINEVRYCGQPTEISREKILPDVRLTRDYSDTEVAILCLEQQWVGFTYWDGGGRHGSPESIPWIEHAYLLNATEKEVVIEETIIKRIFSLTNPTAHPAP